MLSPMLFVLLFMLSGCAGSDEGGSVGSEVAKPGKDQGNGQEKEKQKPKDEPPPDDPVSPLTSYRFTGTTGIGTVEGTFTVDLNTPIGTNVRGWDNRVYGVTVWDFTATSNWELLPTRTFTEAVGRFEYCVGFCTFGGDPGTVLTMTDDLYRLKLTFVQDFLDERGSWYEEISGPVATVQTGTLVVSVAEPLADAQ